MCIYLTIFISDASPSADEVFSKVVLPHDDSKDPHVAKRLFIRHKSKSLDFSTFRGKLKYSLEMISIDAQCTLLF